METPAQQLSKGQKKKLKERLKKQQELLMKAGGVPAPTPPAPAAAPAPPPPPPQASGDDHATDKLSKSQRKKLKAKLKLKQEPIEYADYIDERQLPAVSVGECFFCCRGSIRTHPVFLTPHRSFLSPSLAPLSISVVDDANRSWRWSTRTSPSHIRYSLTDTSS